MDGCLTFLVTLRITTWSFVSPGFVGGYSWGGNSWGARRGGNYHSMGYSWSTRNPVSLPPNIKTCQAIRKHPKHEKNWTPLDMPLPKCSYVEGMAMNFIKQTADHVILVVQICKNSLVTFLLKLEIPVGWSCSTPSTPRRLWRGGVFTPIGFEIAGGLEKHGTRGQMTGSRVQSCWSEREKWLQIGI